MVITWEWYLLCIIFFTWQTMALQRCSTIMSCYPWILLQYVHLNCCMNMLLQHKNAASEIILQSWYHCFEVKVQLYLCLSGIWKSTFLMIDSHRLTYLPNGKCFCLPKTNDHQSCAFLTGSLSSVFTSEVILYILCTNL